MMKIKLLKMNMQLMFLVTIIVLLLSSVCSASGGAAAQIENLKNIDVIAVVSNLLPPAKVGGDNISGAGQQLNGVNIVRTRYGPVCDFGNMFQDAKATVPHTLLNSDVKIESSMPALVNLANNCINTLLDPTPFRGNSNGNGEVKNAGDSYRYASSTDAYDEWLAEALSSGNCSGENLAICLKFRHAGAKLRVDATKDAFHTNSYPSSGIAETKPANSF